MRIVGLFGMSFDDKNMSTLEGMNGKKCDQKRQLVI